MTVGFSLKVTKKKIFFSLFPFYLLIMLLPLWIEMNFEGFMETTVGGFLFGLSFLSYGLFLYMAFPFYFLLYRLNLISDGYGGGLLTLPIPEISFMGLFLLAIIYFFIFYLVGSIKINFGNNN
jgi:hypothetical protein